MAADLVQMDIAFKSGAVVNYSVDIELCALDPPSCSADCRYGPLAYFNWGFLNLVNYDIDTFRDS